MKRPCPDHPCLACGFYAWHWIGIDEQPVYYYCTACATPAPGMPEPIVLVAEYMTGLRAVDQRRI